jgi:putative aldouronate transport system substrate-binding protein
MDDTLPTESGLSVPAPGAWSKRGLPAEPLGVRRAPRDATLLSRRVFVRGASGGLLIGVVALLDACGPSSPATAQPTPAAAAPVSPTTAPVSPTAAPKPTTPSTGPTAPAPATAVAKPTTQAQPFSVPGQIGVSKSVRLPARVTLPGAKPDLPGSDDGLIDPGYINYPANPVKAVAEKPGTGGDVTVATWTLAPPPPAMESNALWQEVNKQLGVNLKLNLNSQADYQSVKLPTIIAGDDLPDILFIAPGTVIAGLPQFLQAKCADLTPYLSGDAVKDYPNLANFSSLAWQGVVFNKAIFGVPAPYPLFLWVHWVHQELLDADNLQQPKNLDEYKSLLKHFTNPQQDQYGLATENTNGYGITNGFFTAMYGLPNTWAVDAAGKLTAAHEIDRYKDAINTAREQWAAGVYSPNSPQYSTGTARADFAARKFAFRFDGFQGASLMFFSSAPNLNPPGKYRIVSPFSAVSGAQPTYWAQPGIFGYSVLKKASPERIKELLRVLNWIAAPFGSQEHLLMRYGVKDVDYTPDASGNPILTQQGKADTLVPWQYITQGPNALYFPTAPEYPQVMQDAEKAMLPFAQIDPTATLYSDTFASKGTGLAQLIYNGVGEVVLGRQPVSAVDQIISDWKSQGGDKMRAEFEQALADARG